MDYDRIASVGGVSGKDQVSNTCNESTGRAGGRTGCRGCLIVIAVAVFCGLWLFSLGFNCLWPSTYSEKRDIQAFDGEPISVCYICREDVSWGVIPGAFSFKLYPGYTQVDVKVRGKNLRCSIRDYVFLFAANVYDGQCVLMFLDKGRGFHLYSVPLDGGQFTEVSLNKMPTIIAYANFGGVYGAEEYTVSDKLLNGEEFYKTSTANLWHQIATGRILHYPMDMAALERFKQQFQAARKEYQVKQGKKPLP